MKYSIFWFNEETEKANEAVDQWRTDSRDAMTSAGIDLRDTEPHRWFSIFRLMAAYETHDRPTLESELDFLGSLKQQSEAA